MKKAAIMAAVAVLSFGLGWWIHDRQQFAAAVAADGRRTDSMQKEGKQDPGTNRFKTRDVPGPDRKNIRHFMSDGQFIHWSPHHADTTGYLCELTLHKKTALYWFHGQCGYDYFTYLSSDTSIDVLWSYRPDCVLDMGFLEKSHGMSPYPRRGDHFALLMLVNDTTLRAVYDFPEWTRKVNQVAGDSIFPEYYYLKRDE